MSKAVAQAERDRRQNLLNWAIDHAPVLIVASVVLLFSVIGLVATLHGKNTAVVVLLSTFLALASGGMTIALAQVIELLKAIRVELARINARIDTELDDIATDLTALRTQMGKGVLGLLGM